MKNAIQIFSLILFISCNNNPTTKEEVNEHSNSEKINKKNPSTEEFVPDSTYVEYWCSTQILKKTAESIENLELATVAEFLASFHKGCKTNVEYSELSNELLFQVTERRPDYLLQLLFKNNSLDKDLIKGEFTSPIHDRIEVKKNTKSDRRNEFPKRNKRRNY